MAQIKIENIQTLEDPIDIIEELVLSNGWEYERDDNRNIHVQVGGNWCDYQLSYGLNEEIKLLYISCALDIKIPDNRQKEIFAFLSSINEKLLIGHFEVWTEDSWPVLRQSFPLPTNQSLCRYQLEQSSLLALKECEKFYPAFQMFAWDNKGANDIIKDLMLETQGEV